MKFWSSCLLLVVLSVLFEGCVQSDYTKLVKSELAKNIRQDSLLMGINFGDTREEFYGKCFDLNQQKLITQGPGGGTVQYMLRDSLFHDNATSIRLLFIPVFDQTDHIMEMNLEFSYSAWAPWNEIYHSDKLQPKVLELLSSWYGGNEFIEVTLDSLSYPVKLDGNRRLIVYKKDAQNVVVKAQDILHPVYKHSITK